MAEGTRLRIQDIWLVRYMEKIEKDKVLSAVVRTFFKYFTLGIIEGSAEDAMDMSIYEPKSVKQYVVKHFEKISATFNEEAFYAFSRMNYLEEEVEEEILLLLQKQIQLLHLPKMVNQENIKK